MPAPVCFVSDFYATIEGCSSGILDLGLSQILLILMFFYDKDFLKVSAGVFFYITGYFIRDAGY